MNEPNPYPIKLNEDLVLHQIALTKSSEFLEFMNNNRAHLQEFDPFPRHFETLESTNQAFLKMQNLYHDHQTLSCLILRKGQIIGYLICPLNLPDQSMRIGYGISQDQQGQGITTRALKWVIEFAFSKRQVKLAWLTCWTTNSASMRVAEKLKFKKSGLVPANPEKGLYHEQYKYVLRRD